MSKKRFLSLLVVLVMVLSSTVSMSAADIISDKDVVNEVIEIVDMEEIEAIESSISDNSYEIIFEKNGASSGEMESQICNIDQKVRLKANTYKRKGYTFNGWNTKKNGKGDLYKNKGYVTNLTNNGKSIKLFAQWKANTYRIKYNANGGKGKMKNESFTYGKKKALSKNVFTKKGYKFIGWATSKTDAKNGIVTYKNKQKVKNLTTKKKGTVNLYAVYSKLGGDKKDSKDDNAASYVLNTNTMKFHKPSCSSAGDIKPKNRQDVNMSRDEIIAKGYQPCKRCNP